MRDAQLTTAHLNACAGRLYAARAPKWRGTTYGVGPIDYSGELILTVPT